MGFGFMKGKKEGPLDGALNLIPLNKIAPIYIYIPYIVPVYLSSPQIPE